MKSKRQRKNEAYKKYLAIKEPAYKKYEAIKKSVWEEYLKECEEIDNEKEN